MDNLISCLIIDDEPPSQRVLEKYITEIPFLKLEAKCMNVFDASAMILQKQIDLIFLDINMPKMTGIEFLRTLKNPPSVIITTAYSDYALEGYELNVVDYLQKPFSFERFFQAVNKAAVKMNSVMLKTNSTNGRESKFIDEYIFVREDKIDYKVDIHEILYLESVGDYVKVHTRVKTYLIYHTLKNFEMLLDPASFKRVHKSFIVALSKIDSIEGNMVKINHQIIPVGTTYRKDFFTSLDSRRIHHH